MARSPIQPKKQCNERSSGGGGWRWQDGGRFATIWKKGVGNIEVGLLKIVVSGTLCQLWNYLVLITIIDPDYLLEKNNFYDDILEKQMRKSS